MNNKNNVKPATPAKTDTKMAPGQSQGTGQHSGHKAKDQAVKTPAGDTDKDTDEKPAT
jgi:hypothetical protein